MRTALGLAVVVLAACGGKRATGLSTPPAPTPGARPATSTAAPDAATATEAEGPARPDVDGAVDRAAPADATDADADAAAPAAGAPVELDKLPVLGAPGPVGTLTVHAADVHAGHLRRALAGAARVNLIERSVPDARLTSRFGPSTAAHLVKVLATGVAGPARPLARAGKAIALDIDFVDADRDDVYRMLAQVLRSSIVVAAPDKAALDLRTRRVPADQMLDVVTARLDLVRARHGTLTWVRAVGSPDLDRALLRRKGPRKLKLDARGARAGEIYALLASLGVVAGGAACDAGPPLTFRVSLPAGTVLAVTAALSGQPPVAGVTCAADAPVASVRDLTVRAIASTATRRLALLSTAAGVVVAARSTRLADARVVDIGDGFVTLEDAMEPTRSGLQLHPGELAPGDDDGLGPPDVDRPSTARLERLIRDGRLAATIVSDRGSEALFELPRGRWFRVDHVTLRGLPADTIRIEPGRVVYRFAPADGAPPTPITGEVVLRRAR